MPLPWSSKDRYDFFLTQELSHQVCLKFIVRLDIAQQLCDGLPWKYMQTFMVPQGRTLLTLGMNFPLSLAHNLVQTIMGPRRRVLLTLIIWLSPWGWHFAFHWNISTTIGWISVKFGTHTYGPQKINYNNLNPTTFHLVPSSVKICYQTPAKLMTLPSASALFSFWQVQQMWAC